LEFLAWMDVKGEMSLWHEQMFLRKEKCLPGKLSPFGNMCTSCSPSFKTPSE
jgi:hypothetical protein